MSHHDSSLKGKDPTKKDDIPLEDVLPSFEMYNYMFNRTIDDVRVDLTNERPPAYTLSGADSDAVNDGSFDADPSHNPDSLLLNHISQLQKIDLPVDVKIVLTKKPARLNMEVPMEYSLKEFRPGELLTGYITIKNRSSEVVPFEMFLVSLEGFIGIDRIPRGTTNLPQGRTKLFLRTYDLSASFHPSDIWLSSHGEMEDSRIDKRDGTMYGFPEDKSMDPGVTYKKFFSFVIPKFVLDTACPYQIPEHLLLPPSFGLDKNASTGVTGELLPSTLDCDNLDVDCAHGYTRIGDTRGSLMKVKDLAAPNQHVTYCITVQFIGANLDAYKKYYNPDTFCTFDHIFLKDIRHFIRINTSKEGAKDQELPPPSARSEMITTRSLPTARDLELLNIRVERMIQEMTDVLGSIDAANIPDNAPHRSPDQIHQSHVLLMKGSHDRYKRKLEKLASQGISSSDLLARDKPVANPNYSPSIYSSNGTIDITKGIFSHTPVGKLTFETTAFRIPTINAIRPKTFDNDMELGSQSQRGSISGRESSITSSSSTTTSSIFSARSNRSIGRNDTPENESVALLSLARNEVLIKLAYQPFDENEKPGKVPLQSLKIKGSLRVINIQSQSSLPVSIDDRYIWEGHLTGKKLIEFQQKYGKYRKQIHTLSKKLNADVPKDIYLGVLSLASINSSERIINDFFKSQIVDNITWKYDETTKKYLYSFPLALAVRPSSLDRAFYIPPSFQTCYLQRNYQVILELRYHHKSVRLTLPLRIE